MSAIMPSTYKKTFNHYAKLFNFIGLDFFDVAESYFTLNNVKLFIYFCTWLPFAFGQFSLMGNIRADNFMESVRVVPIDIMLLLGIVKITIAIVKRSEIRGMFLEIGELWPKDCSVHKMTVLQNYLRRIQLPLDLFLIYAYVNLVIFEVVPFLMTCYYIHYNGSKVYLFPFQPTNAWAYDNYFTYFVTYLMELVCSIPCQMCVYLPFDLTIVMMTSNVSALLGLLQEDLRNSISVDNDAQLRNIVHISNQNSCVEIKKLVHIHQRLLRLADKLSDIFGLVIFIHLVMASIEICFFGFLTMVYGGLAESIINLLTAMSAVFTIFLLALSGQTLSDTSSKVADAAYQSAWYASDKDVKKYILFIIIRAQNPSYLSALGFSQLTLASFSKIMSSAWTYFSLLIQMYGET